MLRALADSLECGGKLHRIAAADQLRARLRQRGDRRERVVELVTDDPDQLLPDPDFLPGELACDALEQIQAMSPALQQKRSLRQAKGLLDALDLHLEQAVASRLDGTPQRLRSLRDESGEILTEEAAAPAEKMSRSKVRESDPAMAVDQNQCDGGVLGDRIEQPLALHELRALRSQRLAQRVVSREHLADLVGPVDGHREGQVAVPVARDGRLQGPQQPA